jgi:hypothetical protein
MKRLMLLLLALLLVFCLVAVAVTQSDTDKAKTEAVKGWVSDEKCGAKAAHEGAAECTKKCVEAGQKIVFVTDKDHKVLSVDNPDTLKDHLGHHVAIDGNVDASAGSIHVDNVSMM